MGYRPWHDQARPEQLPPDGDWSVFLFTADRGAGKTRAAAEWIVEQAVNRPGTNWAIVSPDRCHTGKVCIEGLSGVLKALLPGELESYNAVDLCVRLSNGSQICGDHRLRGTALSGAWVEELSSMTCAETMWNESLMPALTGADPWKIFVTDTPPLIPGRMLWRLASDCSGQVARAHAENPARSQLLGNVTA